jgi:hypothetical protein
MGQDLSPRTVTITLSPDAIDVAGGILCCLDYCTDPIGQRHEYREMFTDLISQLAEKGVAVLSP